MSDFSTIEAAQSRIVRILLVEDDDGSALLLQTVLTHWLYGVFNIRRAENLSAAVRAVAQGEIDIILLDLGLPDSQGLDTFLRMRESAAGVPIIVLSGMDDEALATTMVQKGAQDYIVKGSMDGSLLARAIRYAIERWRAQHALAEEHALLRSVIDNIPDQVYLKDMESRFVAVNPITARFFGASSPDQIVGKTDFDFFPHELAAQFLAEEQALLYHNQPCVNREAGVSDFSGNKQWILTTKVALRDSVGNITGLLGINRDITARKKAEEDIRRMNTELEQRVVERTSELRKAMACLEEHDRARSEFVSSVSHELKTPLTSMKFEIANLLAGVVDPLPYRVTEYLHMLESDCQRMARTVEDILDLSRLEAKTMRLNRSKRLFERLIRQAATSLSVQAQAKNIGMILSLGQGVGFVDCDALKTERVLINIIGNAIKFTPKGGGVEIGLHRDATEPAFLVVDVTDNGIGIAPQHLPRVTDKYFRAGEHVSGAGLGLSIAKEIVELHGGWLRVQSPPPGGDRGTRVSVGMPATEAPTILIANDNEPVRRLLEQQLCACGYHVISCAADADPISQMRYAGPDAGVLSAAAATDDGTDLIFFMKADQQLSAIPLVVTGGGNLGPAKAELLKSLGIALLPEPWRDDDLLDRIETVMGGGEAAHKNGM